MYQEIDTLGSFFGAHKTPLMLDRVMFSRIPHERIEHERMLFDHKWFDYRFMHPALATYYFAHVYKAVYKRIWERHIDRKSAQFAKGIKVEDIFEADGNTLSAIWRCRQVADAMGIPYNLYIELAMTKALSWQRKFLPRPAQLYSDQIIDAVHAGWEDRTKGRFYVTVDPRYRLDQWAATPAQIAHESWICTQIARRTPGTRSHLLHKHLWVDPIIREDFAIERFGEEEVRRAREEG